MSALLHSAKRNPPRRAFVGAVFAFLLVSNTLQAQIIGAAVPAQPPDAPAPAPPQQNQPWTPPATKLPPVVVDAVAQLFRDGMPDPRGCDYREIEVAQTPTYKFKVHAWVLPGDTAQKYAIGWNGVIYPIVSVGPAVNLDQEVAALGRGPGRRFRGNGNGWPMSDVGSLNLISALPIQVAFLLRLGKTTLAEQAWDDGYAGEDEMKAKDPYADMATTWLDRSDEQAVNAFLANNDALALAICRRLAPVVAQCRAIAVSRGQTDPWPANKYDSHLWQLPALQADAARRVQEKPYTPVLNSPITMPDGPERITALIRDLELVDARQMMNPGEAEVADDPIVQALVKEGQPAVEPLIGVLASDDRLTRTRYTSGMNFDGPIVPVYECAYKALFRIFNVNYPLFEHDSQDPREQKDPRSMTSDDRARLAGKLAELWMKSQGMSLAEGGYLALEDDKAGPQEWYRAIDNICQPADGTITGYILNQPQGSYHPHQGNEPFKAFGDALHAKTNPSVSSLIIKRFEQLVQAQDATFDSNKLSNMLLALADWDGKAHVADLKRLGAELDAHFEKQTGGKSGQVNVTLAERRLQLGDSSALADYLAYMSGLAPDALKNFYHNGEMNEFSILWHYPDDPGAQQLAEKIFGAKDASLVPLPNNFIATPLIGLPAFRRELLRGLDDKSPGGTYTVQDNGYNCQYTATQSGIGGGPAPPDAPKPGTVVEFRLCDIYAHELDHIEGFPACEVYWPDAKRDLAVAACKALLQQYADALKARPDDPYDDGTFIDPTAPVRRFRLAPLDHPATPDDVKAGRAIFSLTGTARVWKMPTNPLGSALQAEEQQVDGKWQRYFGVIRDGHPVQVTAAEMDFQDTLMGAVAVTKQLGGAFTALNRDAQEFDFMAFRNLFVLPGEPVLFKLALFNHNGEDQPVPAELTLPPHATHTLPAGLTIDVAFSPKIPPVLERFDQPRIDLGPFTSVPLRSNVTVGKPGAPGSILTPTQTATILQGDLRDYFDFTRPGTYRVTANFHITGQPPSSAYPITFSIAPKP